jgi:hypothetical protein
MAQLPPTPVPAGLFPATPVAARKFPIAVAQRLDIRLAIPRRPDPFGPAAPVIEQTWHQETELRPDLRGVVSDRHPRQA